MEFHYDGLDERGNRSSLTRFLRSFLVIATAIGIGCATPARAIAPVHEIGFIDRTPMAAMAHAHKLIQSPVQWGCLKQLWTAESNWRPNAYNHTAVRQNGRRIHAGGIPQILGLDPATSVRDQIQQGLDYIENRYDTPCHAWNFHLRHNWY